MLSKNKEYVVDIVDIGQGGVGIGKYDGFTVFVEGGLINDKVKVKINKSKKNYAVGDIVEIIEKSPFRVDRLCSDSLKECGGCQIQELDYKKQLEIKMDPDDANMYITMRVTNIATAPQEFSIWGLTVSAINGTLIMPMNSNDTGLLHNRNISVWPYTNLADVTASHLKISFD